MGKENNLHIFAAQVFIVLLFISLLMMSYYIFIFRKIIKYFDHLRTCLMFDVFLTVHHSIDFSKYQLSAQFF